MNPTPKQSFLKTQDLRLALEKWVVTKEAEEARNVALLEFVNRQPKGSNPSEAWDQHSRLVGAREVLEILFGLPFVELDPPVQRLPNLKAPH